MKVKINGVLKDFKVLSLKIFFLNWQKSNFSYFLVPEAVSPLHVHSVVCMAPFHVRSKVCIASFYVRSKYCIFALHLKGSNADFAPHMEWRHSFREPKNTKIAISAQIFFFFLFQTTYILEIYMIYVTTFENKNTLRESTIKETWAH